MDAYSYCVLRYVHDPVAGESVNVGVLLYARDASFVRFVPQSRTRGLSGLFAGFERDSFVKFLESLVKAAERLQLRLLEARRGLFEPARAPQDAGEVARTLFCDNDLSFQWGEVRGGVTRDLPGACEALFVRMVSSQRPERQHHIRRGDEAVWSSFQAEAKQLGVVKRLVPRIVTTPEFPIAFEHSFKNENIYAVETLSLDYADSETIQQKATEWLGNGLLLGLNKDFGSIYFLLGEPGLESQKADFVRACNVLRRLPIKPKIYREYQAREMAEEVAAFMKEHGLLSEPDVAEAGSRQLPILA